MTEREQLRLTDSEIAECFNGCAFESMVTADDLFYLIARSIEKKVAERFSAAIAAQDAEPMSDKGPWLYHPKECSPGKETSAFVESDDFRHDVRLYIDGDFAGDEDRDRYGQMIASRLNEATPSAQQIRDKTRESKGDKND